MGGGGGQSVPDTSAAQLRAAEIQAAATREAAEIAQETAREQLASVEESTGVARADLAPQREAGFVALDELMGTLGLPQMNAGSSAFAAREAAVARGEDVLPLFSSAPQGTQIDDQGFVIPPEGTGGQQGQQQVSGGSGGSGFNTGGTFGDLFDSLGDLGASSRARDTTGLTEGFRGLLRDRNIGDLLSGGTQTLQEGSGPLNHGRIRITPNPGAMDNLRGLSNFFGSGGDNEATAPAQQQFFDDRSTTQDPEEIMQKLLDTPGARFTLEQGQKATERSAAARGGLLSGNTLNALQEQGQSISNQLFNQRVNQLSSLAGFGQIAGQQSANLSQQAGSQSSAIQGAMGSNLANAALSRGSAFAAAQIPQFQQPSGGGGGGFMGALGGAASGAALGSSFGPIGTAVGGGLGLLGGLF